MISGFQIPNYTKESLVARYGNSHPGSTVESNQHVDAAQLIKDTLVSENQSRSLIGEDCRSIEKDVPGELVLSSPTQLHGEWGREDTKLEYDPSTQSTRKFVDKVLTDQRSCTLLHNFEEGNEIFQRITTDSRGRLEATVICPLSGQPMEYRESYEPNTPQLHQSSGGALAMF